MFHRRANSAGNTPNLIPSAKASALSALETAQRLFHQSRAAEDRAPPRTRNALGIAWFMFATLSSTIGSAATIEEVAHCRAIPQLAQRLNCFKSLTPGPRSKMKAAAPAKQVVRSFKMNDAARLGAKRASPAKADVIAAPERTAPAKAEQAIPTSAERIAPAKTEQAVPAKVEEAAPTKAEQTAPAKTEQVVPANKDEGASANTETPANSKAGDSLFSPPSADPATTSSIDRLRVAGQPLCRDADAVGAMILAGLLTSDPKNANTPGCQFLPNDAMLEIQERLPSVFPSLRIVRVRVTSPTHLDLTSGFTIEIER
jgi:outer membrane biosynthesis protein TonB